MINLDDLKNPEDDKPQPIDVKSRIKVFKDLKAGDVFCLTNKTIRACLCMKLSSVSQQYNTVNLLSGGVLHIKPDETVIDVEASIEVKGIEADYNMMQQIAKTIGGVSHGNDNTKIC